MAKGYWKAVLAAAFFIVAGVCYGGSLFREGSIVLEGETAAGGAGLPVLRHLTEGLHDGLIYVLHAYSPICAASVSAKPRMASAIM